MKKILLLLGASWLCTGLAFYGAPDFRHTPPDADLTDPAKANSDAAPAVTPESGTESLPDAARDTAQQAIAEFNKGDLAGAKRDFQKVLALAPNNAPTFINLGLIAYRQKNYEEAEHYLTAVARTQPETGAAWLILGVVYFDQNKLDHALAALSQAVVLEPKNARAHHFLGVTVGKKGWYLGAEDELRKAIELRPDYAEAHFDLAVMYLQRTPPAVELARRHYQKALDLGAAPDSQIEKSLGNPKD